MTRHDNKELIESLINSKIFQDYEKAFSETTLPLRCIIATEFGS